MVVLPLPLLECARDKVSIRSFAPNLPGEPLRGNLEISWLAWVDFDGGNALLRTADVLPGCLSLHNIKSWWRLICGVLPLS